MDKEFKFFLSQTLPFKACVLLFVMGATLVLRPDPNIPNAGTELMLFGIGLMLAIKEFRIILRKHRHIMEKNVAPEETPVETT